MLTSAMGGLGISKQKPTLSGLPLAQGKHIRFDGEGQAVLSPSSGKLALRGLPEPSGKHQHFDE